MTTAHAEPAASIDVAKEVCAYKRESLFESGSISENVQDPCKIFRQRSATARPSMGMSFPWKPSGMLGSGKSVKRLKCREY